MKKIILASEIYLGYWDILKNMLGLQKFREDLNKVRATIIVRDFALALLSIFAPIYLVQSGYSFRLVVMMFLVESICHITLMVPVAKIGSRRGLRLLARLSAPVSVLYLLLLYLAGMQTVSLILLGLVRGTVGALYYPWYHAEQARVTQRQSRGVQIAWTSMIRVLCLLPAPILGGFVLENYGISYLLIISLLILVFAFIPMFSLNTREEENYSFSMAKIFQGRSLREYVAFAVKGMDNMLHEWIWPLFIFFTVLKGYETLGIVTSIAFVFGLITDLVVGKYTDKNSKAVLHMGSLLSFGSWIVAPLINTSFPAYVFNSVSGVAHKLSGMSISVKSYDTANDKGILEYIIYIEVLVHIGRILLYILLLAAPSWDYVFVTVAFLFLSYLWL